jgi:hypothetical protein
LIVIVIFATIDEAGRSGGPDPGNGTVTAGTVACPAPMPAPAPAMPGPVVWPNGPHNQTIKQRIDDIAQQNPGWVHVGGGTITEETIQTPNGTKTRRRADITFDRQDGTSYREQVGKQDSKGEPVTREKQALDDIEGATGERPGFTPYN